MSVVLYLSNNKVQVISGNSGGSRVSVKNNIQVDAPEGCIINGIIMDVDKFSEFIKEFWKQNSLPKSGVTLVVTSSKFMGKTIEMPRMNETKTFAYIEREFKDIIKDEDPVFGYRVLGEEKGMKKLYVEMVSKEFVSAYNQIFKSIGISLSGVYSGQSSMINLVGLTAASNSKTFVFLIAEDNTITTIMWINGAFFHFSSVRCFHEKGTEEYVGDVVRAISKIKQYMQANHYNYEYEKIVLAGVDRSEIDRYTEAIKFEGINSEVVLFDGGKTVSGDESVQYYLYPLSGLFSSGKCHNFLKQVGKIKKENSVTQKHKSEIVIVGIVLIVMLVTYISTSVVRYVKDSELQVLEDYNNSPDVQIQLTEYDMEIDRNNELAEQKNVLKEINENIKSYPVVNKKINAKIKKCAKNLVDTQITTFDSTEGMIVLAAESSSVDKINVFIKKLSDLEMFEKVDYTGYSFDEVSKKWDIHVNCILKEAVGRK